jgi:curved DNA-binding protein CbpA
MADDQYWYFLGLKAGASAAEITAARNRMAKLFHPDRGGSKEDMRRLRPVYFIRRRADLAAMKLRGDGAAARVGKREPACR